jgi:hypothetical protein
MTHPSKVKGDAFERMCRDYLAEVGLPVDRIPAGASNDRGDLWFPGHTLQCKNHGTPSLGSWWAQTQRQREYNRHPYAWCIHKRRGVAAPGDQFVTCDLGQLRMLLSYMAANR